MLIVSFLSYAKNENTFHSQKFLTQNMKIVITDVRKKFVINVIKVATVESFQIPKTNRLKIRQKIPQFGLFNIFVMSVAHIFLQFFQSFFFEAVVFFHFSVRQPHFKLPSVGNPAPNGIFEIIGQNCVVLKIKITLIM